MVFPVFSEEHRRHAPPTQLTLDRVAVSESGTERLEQIGHEMSGPSLQRAPAPRQHGGAAPPLLSCHGSFPYL